MFAILSVYSQSAPKTCGAVSHNIKRNCVGMLNKFGNGNLTTRNSNSTRLAN